jgi:hypothetical protein
VTLSRSPSGVVALLVTALLTAAFLGGCSWSASLQAREATVHFDRSSSLAERTAARAACLDLPHATPEPVATDALSTRAQTEIRYRVDHADDHDLAVLYSCLEKQPGVLTVETLEVSGGNNG